MISNKGYTLMEIIIVLALISIILGIAFPKTSFLNKIQEKKELEDFRRDLLFARNRAIIESREYIVTFDIKNNKYLIKTGKNKNLTVRHEDFGKHIRFDDNSPLKSIIFSYKSAKNSSGTLYLRNKKNERYKFTLSPVTGRIELELLKLK